MQLSNNEAQAVKAIYDRFYAGEVSAAEALSDLEVLIAESGAN